MMNRSYFYLIAIAAAVVISSCSNKQNNWTDEERSLIAQEQMVMRVLSVDNPEDLTVLRLQSSDLKAKYIAKEEYRRLAEKLLATVTDPSQDGVGIAAPQVGISKRIVAVQRFDKEGEPFEVYPNIHITDMRGELQSGPEGCLSVPNRRGEVYRSQDITVSYTSPFTLKDTSEIVKGYTAVIFQHECDHLNGVVYTDRIWGSETSWYDSPREFDENFTDVFYITSTVIISQTDKNGKEVFNAVLDSESAERFDYEMKKASENAFTDSLNFFSPYYHQATMSAFANGGQILEIAIEKAKLEIFDAFDYYMNNINNGRRFILAGFSQGAKLVKELLKHLDEEQFSRLVAAYLIGVGISEEDARNPHIVPATDEISNGVSISFCTVADTSGIYPVVYENSITCINPVNWHTDSTPAEFIYKGLPQHVYVDTTKHVLIVNDFIAKETAFSSFFPKGCLHSWDLSFYAPYIGENAKRRSYDRVQIIP